MATAIEYGLIAALIGVAVVASLGPLSDALEAEVEPKATIELPDPPVRAEPLPVRISYPTEAEALSSGDCGNPEVLGDRLVLPHGDGGYACEVQRGDP